MKWLMPDRLLSVLRARDTTPLELPGDAAREARHRVKVAAILGALAYGVFLAFELNGAQGGSRLERSLDLTHDLAGLTLCAALLCMTLVRAIGDRAIIALALATQVLLCALISVQVTWAGFVRTGHVTSLTWAVPVIILFPLLVPIPPTTALVTAAVSASMMPIALWALAARGAITIGPGDVIASVLTGGVAVGIADVSARAIYGARRQTARAQMLGSYELIERLGQGGMGEVWRAQHMLLARPAAVKLILPERLQGAREAHTEVTARFTREARVTAGLRSPHTVELFDFGVGSDGSLYYAMELHDGLNAEHFVYRFGAIEPRRAVAWLGQACHSLGEAHARGLVHRDIKPSNIMLCRYGRDCDFVKLLDFGLTRTTEASTEAELTTPGARVGTPSYMAPEQVFGMASEPRTDLYALGCVGYWLIAGVKPFEAASAGELMRQHAQAAPLPLSAAAAQPVPARLESLIMACLSKDPADRPPDADSLGVALGESLDGPHWSEADAREWWERNLAEPSHAPGGRT